MPVAVPRIPSSGKAAPDIGPAVGGRGLKGLFSRNKVISPEPADQPTRSRFRTLVDDVSGKVPGAKTTQKERFTKLTGGRLPGKPSLEVDRNPTPRPTARRRPESPDNTTRRGRIGIALPPAMQKGHDGKWQPPSLSKGSMSTSALAQLQDDDDNHTARPAEPKRDKAALHGLFDNKGVARDAAARKDGRSSDGRTIKQSSKLKEAALSSGPSPVVPKASPAPPVVFKQTSQPQSPTITARTSSIVPGSRQAASPAPSDRPGSRHTSRIQVTSLEAEKVDGRARAASVSSDHLSIDHYHIRLATSFLLKTLTPIIQGSAFATNEKNSGMKRLADERLAGLGRIEKHWGAEWIRAAAAGFEQTEQEGSARKEKVVRMANLGERAKERERRGFLDALRDGVLLCL